MPKRTEASWNSCGQNHSPIGSLRIARARRSAFWMMLALFGIYWWCWWLAGGI
jgi:hypothetical protein